MNRIKIFKVLTYILSVPTAFMGFFSFFALLVALMNPPMLIPVFVMICVVVYVITSFVFLNKTIIANKPTKKLIKDLYKINGIIASIFAVMCIVDFVSLFVNPSIISIGIANAMEQNPTSFPPQITKEMLMKFSWFLLSFIGIYAILLSIHLVIGFKLLKEYASSFLQD
jgi:hypothetical protein